MRLPFDVKDFIDALSFKANPLLRPAGAKIAYTKEMITEYRKCAKDPIYFIKNYVKVIHPDRGLVLMDLYEYQERMVLTYHKNRLSIGLTARQMGKCLGANTKVKIRSKESGEIVEITLGEFYVWQKFNEKAQEVLKDAPSESL